MSRTERLTTDSPGTDPNGPGTYMIPPTLRDPDVTHARPGGGPPRMFDA